MLAMIVARDQAELEQARCVLQSISDMEERVFPDANAALRAARENCFDLIVLDHDMALSDMTGLTKALRETPNYSHVPILVMMSSSNASLRLRVLQAGATNILSKTSTCAETAAKLQNLLSLLRATREREDHVAAIARDLEVSTRKLHDREEEVIFRLALVVEYRDNDTGDHTCRVARHARMIAEELDLPPSMCRALYLAAPLHDIGKVAIPDRILLKPGRLDEAETRSMRTHADIGERILRDSTCELLRLAAEIAGHHHERWDGRGYPRGVSGTDIPLSARIVAVADVFDAMTSERPYKAAIPVQEALDHVLAERGRHFDPDCADAFVAAYRRQHAFFSQVPEDRGEGSPDARIAAAA